MQNIPNIVEQEGSYLELRLSDQELQNLRQLIQEHYTHTLQTNVSDEITDFEDFIQGIQDYHQVAPLINHSKMWSKENRILHQEAIDKIHQMPFFKTLQKHFGTFEVSDEEEVGREEFYFRLCRPNEPSDFGPLHADSWFWELGHGKTPKGKRRVKVWIAIFVEKGLNGFRYVPKSHIANVPYHGIEKEGFAHPKPQIDVKDEDLDIRLFDTDSGGMIIFHDKLLHGGAENRGHKTRVSLEFTMFVDEKLS